MSESAPAIPVSALGSVPGFLALGGGTGLAPKAPGTVGSVLGIPLVLVMPQSLPAYIAVVVVLALIGIWCCSVTARELGVHDHPGIVWDEIVGFLVVMIAAPREWLVLAIAFVFFRVFDILKPWPIGPVDRRVHGGIGIMADDLMAGVFAALCLQGVLLLLP